MDNIVLQSNQNQLQTMAFETLNRIYGRYSQHFTGQYPLNATCKVHICPASTWNRTWNLPHTRQPPCLCSHSATKMSSANLIIGANGMSSSNWLTQNWSKLMTTALSTIELSSTVDPQANGNHCLWFVQHLNIFDCIHLVPINLCQRSTIIQIGINNSILQIWIGQQSTYPKYVHARLDKFNVFIVVLIVHTGEHEGSVI